MPKTPPKNDPNSQDAIALKPIKHPQLDFFIAEILDAVPLKSDRISMEFPMFSLSKNPDTRERSYRHDLGNGEFVEVRITPSIKGIATQGDKDFLIACISQYMLRKNRGLPVSKKIRVRPKDLLIATNRHVGGRDQSLMHEAFERMEGTRIRTNINSQGVRQREGFGIIEQWKIITRPSDGRADFIEVTLSDWLVDVLESSEVLTLHADYFRLPSPLLKRLYELGRKHCGYQAHWWIGLDKLRFKTGSQASLRRFRQMIKELYPNKDGTGSLDFLEYTMAFDAAKDMVHFYRKPEYLLTELQAMLEIGDSET